MRISFTSFGGLVFYLYFFASEKLLPFERTKEKRVFLWFFAHLFVTLQANGSD